MGPHTCTCREVGSSQAPLCTLHPSRKSHSSSPSSKTAPKASPSAISSTSSRGCRQVTACAVSALSARGFSRLAFSRRKPARDSRGPGPLDTPENR
eukprot:scaffold93712_cov69-Phaeocystis_antarctica.AAC.7